MLRKVQTGTGPDVLLIYHLTAELDAQVKAGAGPELTIGNQTEPPFANHYSHVGSGGILSIADALHTLGVDPANVGNLIICGFSEGCQALRTLLLAYAYPSAMIAIDGVHGGLPPENYQVEPFVNYGKLAQEELRAFVLTHSSIVPTTFTSTIAMAGIIETAVMGPEKTVSAGVGDDTVPAVSTTGPYVQTSTRQDGLFLIEGYSGKDAPAHVYQAKTVLPAAIGKVREMLAGKSFPWTPGGGQSPPMNGHDIAPFGGGPAPTGNTGPATITHPPSGAVPASPPTAPPLQTKTPPAKVAGGGFGWVVAGGVLLGVGLMLRAKALLMRSKVVGVGGTAGVFAATAAARGATLVRSAAVRAVICVTAPAFALSIWSAMPRTKVVAEPSALAFTLTWLVRSFSASSIADMGVFPLR